MSEDCIFCRIVAGTASCHRVYEDERVLSFMDHAPVHEGHLLVIPKRHGADVYDSEVEDLEAVMSASHRIAPALRDEVKPAGMRVVQLNGAPAGQTVFHYHLHLIPCGEEGFMGVHGRVPGDPARLAELAAALRARLGERA